MKSKNSSPPSTQNSGDFNWNAVNVYDVDDESVEIDEAAIYERVKRAAVGEEGKRLIQAFINV